MKTNNTERGGGDGWEEVGSPDFIGKYRYRYTENGVEVQWFNPYVEEWQIDHSTDADWIAYFAEERTAARDRDAALAELVATWKQDSSDQESVMAFREGVGYCMRQLEALLTSPTPHVEADRQGDVMRQMYQALKLTRDIMNFGPGHQISKATAAYEALHGTEGVREG